MNSKSTTLVKVLVWAAPIIAVLVAAAWFIPPDFPMLWRQILLGVWGVGGTLVAERVLFSPTVAKAWAALGFVPARMRSVIVALLVSVPMWIFLPLYAWFSGVSIQVHANWFALLIGVVLVNGIAEEVIHRAFIFGNLRREHSYAWAATICAIVFAVQHLYLVLTIGWAAGLSSVLLATLLVFPLIFIFEKGGNSIGAPAILHTSSNAPYMVFALPASFSTAALIPHMGVVLLSMYLIFAFRKYLSAESQPVTNTSVATTKMPA